MDKVRKYFLVTVNDNTLPIYFTEFCSFLNVSIPFLQLLHSAMMNITLK
jgi:hypothetical protein